VDVLKSATDIVQSVKSTVDAVSEQPPVAENKEAGTGKPAQTQTAYMLVPVDKDKYVMQNVPVDGGTPQ
jgi:stress response protein YsnF